MNFLTADVGGTLLKILCGSIKKKDLKVPNEKVKSNDMLQIKVLRSHFVFTQSVLVSCCCSAALGDAQE